MRSVLQLFEREWWWCAVCVGCAACAHAQSPSPTTLKPRQWPSERQVGSFVVHADFALDDQLSLLRQLEPLQQDVQRHIEVAVLREPVHVFLFAQSGTYSAYVRQHFPQAPQRKALYIKQGGPGMIFASRSANLAVDLRHEGVHAILHASLPMVPLWLDEGLAEYFEVDPSQRPSRRDYVDPIRRQAAWRRFPTLASLEAQEGAAEMTAADYRWCWAWTHFLLHGPLEAREELQAFLGDIARHVPPDRLSVRLRRRAPNLDQQFQAHWRTWAEYAPLSSNRQAKLPR